jgi:hypothetical protein
MTHRFIAKFLILALLLQSIIFFHPDLVSAAPDSDGSANLDLTLTPSLPSSAIIGQNFAFTVSLKNENTSDGDGYRAGFILSLPTGVTFQSAPGL